MKKLVFILLLLLPVLAFGQSKPKASIDNLNAEPSFAEFVLGDSLTHYLTRLDLIEELGNGAFKCEATDRENFAYRLRGVSPIAVYLNVEKYRIKSIYAVYPYGNSNDLIAGLMDKYGNYSTYSNGSYNWYGNDVFVMSGTNGNKTSFVIYTYVRPI